MTAMTGRPRIMEIHSMSGPVGGQGDPDLQGIWANDVSTPLQRPSRFADKAR